MCAIKSGAYIRVCAVCHSACSCSARPPARLTTEVGGSTEHSAIDDSYVTTPLCRMFCAEYSPSRAPSSSKVRFNVDRSELLPRAFTSQQKYVTTLLGKITVVLGRKGNIYDVIRTATTTSTSLWAEWATAVSVDRQGEEVRDIIVGMVARAAFRPHLEERTAFARGGSIYACSFY